MSTYNIPGQNLSLNIPDDNEIFIDPNDQRKSQIFLRNGNQISAYDFQSAGQAIRDAQQKALLSPFGLSVGQTVSATAPNFQAMLDAGAVHYTGHSYEAGNNATGDQLVALGRQKFQEQTGIDPNNISKGYNMADVHEAVTRLGGGITGVNDPSEFKVKPTVETTHVQGVNPDNVNSYNVKNSDGSTYTPDAPKTQAPGAVVPGTDLSNPNKNIQENGTGPLAVVPSDTAPIHQADQGNLAVSLGGGVSTKDSMAPNASLKPGDTGQDVKKLQDYLVAKGLMTQEQVNTGYGTYGPQTTAAIAALQKQLGIDNSTGVGYFGPRTITALGATSGTSTPAPTTSAATVHPELLQILQNPTLTGDQKAIIQSVFNAVSSNDADTASKIQAAMKAASEYSDPYFKAQIQLATDALDRGIHAKDGDLSYQETSLKNALDKLKADTTASRDQLSFAHAQELQQLGQKYETDLSTTRDNLASSGFTSSSKRARAEQILNDQNKGLVESSNKGYSYQTGNLDRTLSTSDAATQAQIENLRRLASEGKIDLLRQGEAAVGSDKLASLGYTGLLGNVGGSIPRQKTLDAVNFANSFVF